MYLMSESAAAGLLTQEITAMATTEGLTVGSTKVTERLTTLAPPTTPPPILTSKTRAKELIPLVERAF